MSAEILSLLKLVAILMCSQILPSAVVAQLPESPSPGLRAQIPPFPYQDVMQCWSSFKSVNGCLSEIYDSFINGRVGSLGPSCCQAISTVSTSCWPKMFPYSPYFPPLLKAYCTVSDIKNNETGRAPVTAPTPPAFNAGVESSVWGSGLDTSSSSSWGTLNPFRPITVAKCLMSLQKTQGCYHEVITSIFSSQVGLLGPRCCKAIAVIDGSCWPRICPLNPFFPPLIKNYCANLRHKTPRTPRRSPWNY